MKLVRRAAYFLRYLLKSGNAHQIHSPFVYDLYNNVISEKNPFYDFKSIEALRKELLSDSRKISVIDFGAGGTKNGFTRLTSIRHIAEKSLKSAEWGQLLFRLVNHFQPTKILELGTCLGISTAYLSSARKQAEVFSLEGSPELSVIASQQLEKLKLNHVKLKVGNFDETLVPCLQESGPFDFVYLDGNHRKEPTLRYLKQILPFLNSGCCVVLDDIHWSSEMHQAWNEIREYSFFNISIDLFEFGILINHPGQVKEHFILRK